jgi:hypothetical protein
MICKGADGEQWAIRKSDFDKNYIGINKVEGDWEEFKPSPDHCCLWAAQLINPVEVNTDFGKLAGNKGDYVIKATKEGSELPERYWIVNGNLFEKIYTQP